MFRAILDILSYIQAPQHLMILWNSNQQLRQNFKKCNERYIPVEEWLENSEPWALLSTRNNAVSMRVEDCLCTLQTWCSMYTTILDLNCSVSREFGWGVSIHTPSAHIASSELRLQWGSQDPTWRSASRSTSDCLPVLFWTVSCVFNNLLFSLFPPNPHICEFTTHSLRGQPSDSPSVHSRMPEKQTTISAG